MTTEEMTSQPGVALPWVAISVSPHLETENIVLCASFAKTYTLDGVEAFGHVGLHRSGVSGLRKDLQQFIVRQKEKPAVSQIGSKLTVVGFRGFVMETCYGRGGG